MAISQLSILSRPVRLNSLVSYRSFLIRLFSTCLLSTAQKSTFLALANLVALFLSAAGSESPAAAAEIPPDPSLAVEKQMWEHGVRIVALPQGLLEATVSLTGQLQNLTPQMPVPCILDVENGRPAAVEFHQADPYTVWQVAYKYQWHVGLRSSERTGKYTYLLPFPKGERHKLLQGYFGNFSHQRGSESEYGLDFEMPEGNTVCAARGGLVVATRSDSREGGRDPVYKTAANYVVIKHGDGTYAWYGHLKQNGALVRIGQTVAPGDPIALSGVTGQASRPHLHFDVYRIDPYGQRKTIPTLFRLAESVSGSLSPGTVYGN